MLQITLVKGTAFLRTSYPAGERDQNLLILDLNVRADHLQPVTSRKIDLGHWVYYQILDLNVRADHLQPVNSGNQILATGFTFSFE